MAEKIMIGNAELWHGDCREILPTLPDCDLILTDPPYGIGIAANPVRQAHDKMEWDAAPPAPWLFGLMLEKAKKMCEQAWCSFKKPAKMYRLSVTSYSKEHPTQKPEKLMEWCMSHAPESATVCDPFMGSGTTGVACVNLGKQFTGIERERKYFDIACERIARAQAQERLFA